MKVVSEIDLENKLNSELKRSIPKKSYTGIPGNAITLLLTLVQNWTLVCLQLHSELFFNCSFHNEGGATAYKQYPVCQGKQLTCSNNILNRMGEFNTVEDIIENKTNKCLTNCEDQINDLFVTTSNYPNKKTFKEREEFCLLVKKLIEWVNLISFFAANSQYRKKDSKRVKRIWKKLRELYENRWKVRIKI